VDSLWGISAIPQTDQLEQQYRLNFLTAWHLTAPILDVMKQQGGGKLFFVGSSQGLDTHKGKNVVAYSLSKSLLFQLANIINADSMHSHVEAFVIVPSTIDTPQNRRDMPDADFNKWEKPATIAAIVGKYLEQKETSKKIHRHSGRIKIITYQYKIYLSTERNCADLVNDMYHLTPAS
jgi:NAD(P)-dependent dehydrogenase (short-subunit alcohol dehydrogenase family)